jgi:CHASE1-domain containing sensor protein
MERLAFDYASLDVMKNAIELAQKNNFIASTELFNLRQDTLSFAIIAPVYEHNTNFSQPSELISKFKGSVVLEINAQKYFENAIKGADIADITNSNIISYPTDTTIIFVIVDKDSQDNENIVFKSRNENLLQTPGFTPLFNRSYPLNIANRELSVVFSTVPGFGATQSALPMIVLAVSLLLSVLAFILILILLTQKARAEEIAERMTASQRRILETSRDIIAVASNDGN